MREATQDELQHAQTLGFCAYLSGVAYDQPPMVNKHLQGAWHCGWREAHHHDKTQKALYLFSDIRYFETQETKIAQGIYSPYKSDEIRSILARLRQEADALCQEIVYSAGTIRFAILDNQPQDEE